MRCLLRRSTCTRVSLSNAARCASSSTSATASRITDTDEGPTYLEYWDRLWTSSVVSPSQPSGEGLQWFDMAFYHGRTALGLDESTGVMLVVFGGVVRLMTLYFSLYGERASARMQEALPELKPAHEQFQRVYYNDQTSALQVQQAATILKAVRRETFKRFRTSNWKTLAGVCGSPLILQGMYTVSRLCGNPFCDVGSSSFAWISALSSTDPLFILPVVCCGLTLINFEWTLSSRMDTSRGTMANVVWGARLLALGAVPAVSHFQSGVLLYWIGLSLVGLLQPVLVRVKGFRQWFGIPEPPAATSDELLQRRMVLQAPTLSYLFEGENGMLVRSTTEASAAAPSPADSSKQPCPFTLSDEMHRVESSSFQPLRMKDVPEGKGTAFVRRHSSHAPSWKGSDKAPVSDMDELLPDAFRQKK